MVKGLIRNYRSLFFEVARDHPQHFPDSDSLVLLNRQWLCYFIRFRQLGSVDAAKIGQTSQVEFASIVDLVGLNQGHHHDQFLGDDKVVAYIPLDFL